VASWIAPEPAPRRGLRADSGHEDAPPPAILLRQRFLWFQPGQHAAAPGHARLVPDADRAAAPKDLQALRSDRVGHARELCEEWREDYNSIRPHSSLGGLSPEQFLQQGTSAQTPRSPAAASQVEAPTSTATTPVP